jgi:hypothetical protein
MNDHDETERTAARLRAALSAAADVMVIRNAAEHQHQHQPRRVKRSGGWLLPLAAAASVVVIALGAVLIAHLASPAAKQLVANSTGKPGATQTTAHTPRPEFYLTATYPSTGPNVLRFQVRRTNGGAVTASTSISAANLGWGGYLTAAAGDRAFYMAEYPCTRTGVPLTTFHRITITGSGRISGIAAAGRPIRGMVTTLAVSPDGSQMAYNAVTRVCAGPGRNFPGAGSVSVEDLSTGTVRTWQDTTVQDTTAQNMVSRLSWASDGRTLIVDEDLRGPAQSDLTVFGLDTTSSGGSLQAHSTTLLQQNGDCSTCVQTALAGPDGSLTALESQTVGLRTRALIVSIPSAAGSPRTVLYSELIDAPLGRTVNDTALFTDPSRQWLLLWPTTFAQGPNHRQFLAAGWISGGRLHPLPGAAQVFPQGIAW